MGKHSTIAQVPWPLSLFDDRYGITWRVNNAIRRFSLARTLRFMQGLLTAPLYPRPILIIGMPRSGTQMLFHTLRECEALGSLPTEGHNVWRRFHHPRSTGWSSDHVGAGEVRAGERRYVNACFFAWAGRKRLMDKTADNLVRVRYLLELFPDAIFVVMKRNPCDAVNSYINMWKQPGGRFRSYYVPMDLAIPGYPHRRLWCSTLIDDWRRFAAAPIPEIAYEQWRQYVDSIEQGRRAVPAPQWVEFFLEDLLDHPERVSRWLFERLEIEPTQAVQHKLRYLLANPINSISPPSCEKWRSQNSAAVRKLLPRIAERSPTVGCTVDPVTGEFSYGSIV